MHGLLTESIEDLRRNLIPYFESRVDCLCQNQSRPIFPGLGLFAWP